MNKVIKTKAAKILALFLAFATVVTSGIFIGLQNQEIKASGYSTTNQVSDSQMNWLNGRSMPCTTYLSRTLSQYFGVSVSGAAGSELSQLESLESRGGATQIGGNYRTDGGSNLRRGDVIVFFDDLRSAGHVAIMGNSGGSSGAMHHGGLGSAGTVQHRYTVSQFLRNSNVGSGRHATYYRAFRLIDWNPNGYLNIKKSSTNAYSAIVSECPNSYSLAGAEYTVYNDQACTSARTGFVTDASGKSTSVATLPVGTYYVRETKAPMGYAIDSTVYPVTITREHTSTVESTDAPIIDPFGLEIQKVATDGSITNENANMEGAKFLVSYYDTLNGDPSTMEPTRYWTLATKKLKSGKFIARLQSEYLDPDTSSSEFFYTAGQNKDPVLPAGTVTIKEISAPHGYKVDPETKIIRVNKKDTADDILVYNMSELPNKPLVPSIGTTASDIHTTDNVGTTGKTTLIDKVQYKELTEGETYTVKGTLMSKTEKDKEGKPVAIKDKDGNKITAEKTFKVTKDLENCTIDGAGASGYINLEYEFDSSLIEGKSTVVYEKLIYKDKEVAAHEEITDDGQTVNYPKVQTTATDSETGLKQSLPTKEDKITDKVACTNLVVGKQYTVKGTLMNKETEKAFVGEDGKEETAEMVFYVTAEGKLMVGKAKETEPAEPGTGETTEPVKEYEFTEDTTGELGKFELSEDKDTVNGYVNLQFTYDSTKMQGNSAVVFEDLYHNDKNIYVHHDIEDKDQTVDYPDVKTTATDDRTGKHLGETAKDASITDKVAYTNLVIGEKTELVEGREYTIKGTLMNKSTGKPVMNNGKEVTAEKKFTPTSKDGYVNVDFKFDATGLDKQDVVVFESLYYDIDGETGQPDEANLEPELVATHSDINDKDQTVRYTDRYVPPKTVDNTTLILYGVIALLGISEIFILRKRKIQTAR